MIFQDGQAFKNMNGDVRAQNVHGQPDLPPRDPGDDRRLHQSRAARPISPSRRRRNWGDRDTNRPTEYNSLDDKYARVICDELLPALYKDYNISKDPEQHGIGGASSGAIAAFTVAWERPDQFRKVLSIVGSFTNLRGGHVYPEKCATSEKKPIRVFLSGRPQRQPRRGTRRQLQPEARLVLAERPAGRGAERKRLRRELHLGHRPARAEARRRDPARDDALAVAPITVYQSDRNPAKRLKVERSVCNRRCLLPCVACDQGNCN